MHKHTNAYTHTHTHTQVVGSISPYPIDRAELNFITLLSLLVFDFSPVDFYSKVRAAYALDSNYI
jgi:hypothetical protein